MAGFRTNEPQSSGVLLFSAMNLMACGRRDGSTPWWIWVAAGLFWPVVAFCVNVLDPLPANQPKSR